MNGCKILIIIFLCICPAIRRDIRQDALENELYSELNSIVEYYSRCYYRLPEKIKDIRVFLNEWEKQAPESFPAGYRGVAESLGDRVEMAAFADSVFLYNRKNKTGCAVYGHPLYWYKHKERYPSERLDYSNQFQSCAYDRRGKYLFNWDSSDLYEQLLSMFPSNDSRGNVHCIIRAAQDGTLVLLSERTQDDELVDSLAMVIGGYLKAHAKVYSVILPL